ncbi:MAG: YkgJ family cysteine cluster protein [Methanomicrobiaceae archaeon]|nr:YkgJ family cysteine cluster protein [Methanomicrobiaceae archaeon]
MKGIKKKTCELEEELRLLKEYDIEELCSTIRDVGFSCTLCGKCCTNEFNGHVFLLDDDTERVKALRPEAIVPAPYFELCDQDGNFYVSGYSLKSNENGECIFLRENRCTIYEDRFSICRIYPYMLHREYGDDDRLDWRQISGLNEHGEYNTEIPDDNCLQAAEDTIGYEKAFLEKEITFYSDTLALFNEFGLKPVRKIYDAEIRAFNNGGKVTVYVHYKGIFEKNLVCRSDYLMSL